MSIAGRRMPNDRINPPGRLADAELRFSDGELEGSKLIGFAAGSGAWAARVSRLSRYDDGLPT